ncbi:ATP-dependent helicase [Corynebacterium testudinoris]|uniref:DNA 3'-5' helicase n=2 Tax=Corynebacterium testudinoris TaxID=136857 RepID=A0A0G3H8G5_9CORY|nr:DNA/RNA helicase, superfamily I [Corynebacterium testudinoris]MBX8996637.1 ATP-dependent helicase [Corynebacterium testudinoris]
MYAVDPKVRLVPRRLDLPDRDWPFDLPATGTWRVTGQAGSGVTSLLVDTVVARLATAGVDPSGVLVVAASKESGARIRRELNDRLAGTDFASQAPLVRSVHSLAFALLRDASEEPIRLITGAEQDTVIRELLQGQADDARGSWPAEIRPALTFVGFARQLRDFLLRSAERGLSPERLESLGAQHGRPMWSAAGEFLREYEQTQALSAASSYTSYSASELVGAALDKGVSSRWHTLIVDDAQHLDPTSASLLSQLVPGTELVVIGGDPEQSIFHFRGASPAFLREFPAEHELDVGASRRAPQREVVIVDTRTTQHDLIADTLRRAHLLDGVPWSEMAVIVRSTGQIGAVRRALLGAGVPVHLNPTDVVLAEQRIVASLVLGIRALTESLSPTEVDDLVLGPIGGADPVTLRRLIRGLRRFNPDKRGKDTLIDLLAPEAELPDFGTLLTEREQHILLRIRRVLDAGRAALDAHGSVEEVLWAVWYATGLSDHLLAASLRGGVTGSQADRDLDAVMSLFDAAGDYAERRPTGSLHSFITTITEQELPTGVRDRRSAVPEAVALLTAHGTVGNQWHTVVVAGAQEGAWPSLGETGSLFDQEELVDLLDADVDPNLPISHTADRLKEERRLFHVATSRATHSLLLTGIYAPDADEVTEPSRFLEEFCTAHKLEVQRYASDPAASGKDYEPLHVRLLSSPALLAELRRAVCDPTARSDVRQQAARQLARLAQAGVPGADPEHWWTTTEPSTAQALPSARALSPSRIEGLLTCPLREVVGKLWDEEESPIALTRGNLAHYYLEALGRGVDPEVAQKLVVSGFAQILDDPEWRRDTAEEDFTRLLLRTRQWLDAHRGAHDLVGVEVPLDVEAVDGVRIAGRMDLLSREKDGGVKVVDLKTARTAITKKKLAEHAQLFAYELALGKGALVDGQVVDAPTPDDALHVASGVLLYPGTDTVKITDLEQVARTEEELAEFAALLPPLLAEMTGPLLTARVNDHCSSCQIRAICPVQPEGKLTIDA